MLGGAKGHGPIRAWQPARVRWLEGSRAEQTPTALFIDGSWRQAELAGEELRQGPQPDAPIRRRFRLSISGETFLLEGPFEQGDWNYCSLQRGLDD